MNDHQKEEKATLIKPENSDSSALYEQDRETGEWTIKNPAGSTAYNYLYRGDSDWLS
jgi:hypothetical protein